MNQRPIRHTCDDCGTGLMPSQFSAGLCRICAPLKQPVSAVEVLQKPQEPK